MEQIWEYVDPDSIADNLSAFSYRDELTAEEAAAAAEAISLVRVPFVMDALRNELGRRNERDQRLEQQIEGTDIIDLEDLAEEGDYWFVGWEDSKDKLANDGRFVNFTDFMLARKQVRTTEEYVTNVFHTLVLFFLEDQPEKHQEAIARLRYNQSNQSWSNKTSPTFRFYIRTEALLPYAPERVSAEYKIPGIGRVGRRLMRAVLFDNEDIEDLLLEERQRFDPK